MSPCSPSLAAPWLSRLLLAALPAAAAAASAPECWGDGTFNALVCCDLRRSPRGEPQCWDSVFTFELCCQRGLGRENSPAGCWSGDIQPELCCDPRRGPRGEAACWQQGPGFTACCGPVLAELAVARTQHLRDLRRWTDGEAVDAVAGVPAAHVQRCVAAAALKNCSEAHYLAEQYDLSTGSLVDVAMGEVCVAAGCGGDFVHRVLVPRDLERQGRLDAFSQLVVTLKEVEPRDPPRWWRFALLVPLPTVALLGRLEAPSPVRGRSSEGAALEWARAFGTAVVLFCHLCVGSIQWAHRTWYLRVYAPFFGGLGNHLFVALSAVLLEREVDRPFGQLAAALPCTALRRVARLGLLLGLVAALKTALLPWRRGGVNAWSAFTIRAPFHERLDRCEESVRDLGLAGDLTGDAGLLADVWDVLRGAELRYHVGLGGCSGWFFALGLRAWCAGALLLLTPWGLGVALKAACLLALSRVGREGRGWEDLFEGGNPLNPFIDWRTAGFEADGRRGPADAFNLLFLLAVALSRALRRLQGGRQVGAPLAASAALLSAFGVSRALDGSPRGHLATQALLVVLLRSLAECRLPRWRAVVWLSDHSLAILLTHLDVWLLIASYQEQGKAGGEPMAAPLLAAAIATGVAFRRGFEAPVDLLLSWVCPRSLWWPKVRLWRPKEHEG